MRVFAIAVFAVVAVSDRLVLAADRVSVEFRARVDVFVEHGGVVFGLLDFPFGYDGGVDRFVLFLLFLLW